MILMLAASYAPKERRPWRLWQTESIGRVLIIRVGSTAFPRLNMKKRVLNYVIMFSSLRGAGCALFELRRVLAMTYPPLRDLGAFVALL